MKIINKKTKEVFEVIGFISGSILAPGGLLSARGSECCIAANVKTKKIERIDTNKLIKDFELKE